MRRRSWFARLVLGTLTAGGLLATQVPDSRAECLWGEIYLTRKNAPSIPVWGPGCITDGPFLQNWTETKAVTEHAVPDGTPNGFFAEVILTIP
ncbi:MAG TPA: hypothetical protein VHF47_07365 [Acidimicrobiales bacterium]|nr:hypothetical protein [Acidimicrobiales bacterium]